MTTPLSPLERSEEILGYAQDYLTQVHRGDVFSSGGPDEGYALNSRLREHHHVPTATAPENLYLSAEVVAGQLKEDKFDFQRRAVIRNLEGALTTLTKAHNLATGQGCRLPEADRAVVIENLESSLPGMQKLVKGMAP